MAFKSPHHSGSGFSLLKYTQKLEEIQRTATRLKSLVNKEELRRWGNLSYEKNKTTSTVKDQGKTDSKFRTILHSKQRTKYDALKFLLVRSTVTKENTQRHINYPISSEYKKVTFLRSNLRIITVIIHNANLLDLPKSPPLFLFFHEWKINKDTNNLDTIPQCY